MFAAFANAMKLFYIAVTTDGKKVRGFIEANDTGKAAVYLREHNMHPIRIEQQQTMDMAAVSQFFNKVSNKDLIFFTKQISSMLSSGLTLSQALVILKNQTKKKTLITIIDNIIMNIEEGKSLSQSLSFYPGTFSPIYLSLVKAGETTGLLDKVMARLADNLEKSDKLKSQIRSALLYPVIVITLMFFVTIIMMIFVIPQLSTLYESLNITLPFATQIIVIASDLVVNYLFYVVLVFAFFVYYFIKWKNSEKGKTAVDKFILKVPIFNKLISQSVMVEFARTFGLLVGTGAVVIESLEKSAEVTGNMVYRKAVLQVAERVEQGIAVGDAMSLSEVFPPILVEMVRIGEQTGKMDQSLINVSEYFEREVEQSVKNLTTALEPIIMVILALGVGFLLVAIITPIYKLISSF